MFFYQVIKMTKTSNKQTELEVTSVKTLHRFLRNTRGKVKAKSILFEMYGTNTGGLMDSQTGEDLAYVAKTLMESFT